MIVQGPQDYNQKVEVLKKQNEQVYTVNNVHEVQFWTRYMYEHVIRHA